MKTYLLKPALCLALFAALFPGQVLSAETTFDFGFQAFHFDYKEDLPAPAKSTESGWLPGVYGSLEYSKKSNLYAKAFLSFAEGDLTFDGTTQPGDEPIRFTHRHWFLKFEGDIGYNSPLGTRGSLIPFIGYGYRYWQRGEDRLPDFQEDYSWSYIPIGIKLDYAAGDRWSLGFTAQANLMFNGKMTAHLGDVGITARNPEFDLGSKVGWYVELPIRCNLSYNWSLTVTPWYEYSAIGESNIDEGFLEPASRTHWYGVNFGLGYRF